MQVGPLGGGLGGASLPVGNVIRCINPSRRNCNDGVCIPKVLIPTVLNCILMIFSSSGDSRTPVLFVICVFASISIT